MTYEAYYGDMLPHLKRAEAFLVELIQHYPAQEYADGVEPILYCKSRIKQPDSMIRKLKLHGFPTDGKTALEKTHDAVGPTDTAASISFYIFTPIQARRSRQRSSCAPSPLTFGQHWNTRSNIKGTSPTKRLSEMSSNTVPTKSPPWTYPCRPSGISSRRIFGTDSDRSDTRIKKARD